MQIKFLKKYRKATDTLIVPVLGDQEPAIPDAGDGLADHLASVFKRQKSFKGKHGQSFAVTLPDGFDLTQVVFCGLGARDDLTFGKVEEAAGKVFPVLKGVKADHVSVVIPEDFLKQLGDFPASELAAHFAAGFKMRSYQFDAYKSKKTGKDAKKADEESDNAANGASTIQNLDLILDNHAEADKHFKDLDAGISGVFWARDLVNEPPNALYPESYAQKIKDELKPLGVDIEILDEKKMQKLGMGAILAVGMGSDRPPRMVIMRWNGAKKSKTMPLALVGKGVTFDTGGISLKPGAGMDEMKMDMGGSAAVVGTMKALALRKAKANVIGIVGLAENMPSARSYRPGDILTSYSGKTIEVLNTDAEGRLVLADCLTYVQEIAKPDTIIDLATLTGAMMVALGHEYCGAFVTHDDLWAGMENAAKTRSEKIWRMPLDEVWKKDVESNVADIQNLGKMGRYGGACTAAGFLQHFINDDKTRWAHMDIAGTAWVKTDKALGPKYGTGYGVRLLDQFVKTGYENA